MFDDFLGSFSSLVPSSMMGGVSSALNASSGNPDALSYDPVNSTVLGGTGSGLGATESDAGSTMASAADGKTAGSSGRVGAGYMPLGSQAHSNAQAAPFHYTSNANPLSVLSGAANIMKNDIDVSKGFNDVKNLF